MAKTASQASKELPITGAYKPLQPSSSCWLAACMQASTKACVAGQMYTLDTQASHSMPKASKLSSTGTQHSSTAAVSRSA